MYEVSVVITPVTAIVATLLLSLNTATIAVIIRNTRTIMVNLYLVFAVIIIIFASNRRQTLLKSFARTQNVSECFLIDLALQGC